MTVNMLTRSPSLRVFPLLLVIATTGLCQAQTLLVPGENVLDKKWIKNGTYEMGCYANAGGKQVEISSFTIHINANNKALTVYTALQMAGSNELSVDTSIADGHTFKPIYRSSFSTTITAY